MMEKLPETDIHNHILPGLDDGSPSLEESLFLAGKLVEYGFKRVVCTPHSTFLYRNTPATVLPACRMLQDALDEAGVPLRLIPSQEYRLIPETWPQMRRNDWLLPWEGNHILIELPIRKREQMGDINMVAEIRQLVKDGYQPVIAHPEPISGRARMTTRPCRKPGRSSSVTWVPLKVFTARMSPSGQKASGARILHLLGHRYARPQVHESF